MELQKNVQPQTESADAKSALWSGLFGKMDVRAYTMVGALILIWVLFGLLDPTFLTARNLSNLFTQMSVTSILAIGMVLVIVAGHIDLSVGSIVGLTGGIAAISAIGWACRRSSSSSPHWRPGLCSAWCRAGLSPTKWSRRSSSRWAA
ncbi:hypothetical protein HMSSN036_95360 [Paenibacillus macerans]|nr:hypothetical protein HMSSN036_95360 [Paenibacillus macerans]